MKAVNSFKSIAVLLAVFFSINANAQLTSCNAFLKGRYIEVGINWTGAYGSSIAAPSGFHPKGPAGEANSPTCGAACYSGGQNLGFVADPDKDGWTIGSPYPYYGDYFLPGSPQEGWAIQADTSVGWAFNDGGCFGPQISNNITGANTSYYTSGKRVYAEWKGTFDSIAITQQTTLDTSTVYFTVYMTLKNLGSNQRKNLYYLRTLDPDNAEPESGSFQTYNRIEYQMPNPDNKVLASATGTRSYTIGDTITSAFLGLGTKDCRARCFIQPIGLRPTISTGPFSMVPLLDSMYKGNSTIVNGSLTPPTATSNYLYKQDTTNWADCGISLVFKLGDIDAGDSITFAYAYILRKLDIDSAFESTSPKWRPVTLADSATHLSGDVVDVCAGNYVPLNIINGAGFKWHWISPTGNDLTDTVGLSTKVQIDTATTIVYAIGITPACQPDTQFITLHPFAPPPPIVSSNSPLCLGDTLKLKAVGIPSSYFTWKGPNGFKTGTFNPIKLNVQTADSGLYYLLDSIPGCPPLRVTTSVLVNAVVADISSYKPAACVGADFTVYFSGRAGDIGTHYKWTFEGAVPKEGTDTIKGPYTLKWDTVSTKDKLITLRVQNDKCISTDQMLVPVVQAPPVDFTVPKDACQNAAMQLSVADYSLVGADSMAWDFDGGKNLSGGKPGDVVSNLKLNYATPGMKAIKLTIDYWRCTAKPDTEYVMIHASPDATINDPGEICEGDSAKISAKLYNNYAYTWGPVKLVDPTKTMMNYAMFTIPQAMPVYLSVKDENNCISTDTLNVRAKSCCTVSFPSAFTPNGDGRNDYFKPITVGHHHIKHYKIVNRYGQVVFESNSENIGWDGTMHGVPQEIGTYFYVFTYDCAGRQMETKGDVTLIR